MICFAQYTAMRDGCCASTVFQVSKPYSLPATSTPKVSARAPTNTGSPPSTLPTNCAGSIAARPRPASEGVPV
ncbi:hypothetical protein [Qaidamihabitans albus]|uniref:hypothetical protein n=1 Tax=Qaidamihabitans albus TaxID=2795733 RepID=UPI001F26EAC2|nr:hypothetical protein [Qaidamihabitans albus]